MAKISILGEKITKTEAFTSLDEFVVRLKLLAEVVRSELLNLRGGNAHTKNRGEVRGGGKKPWKQKGTGRARHGSTRSPIWVGGGVAFGPRNTRNWNRKINKTAKLTALKSILKDRLDEELVFQLKDSFSIQKTKNGVDVVERVLNKISGSNSKSVLMVYTTEDKPNIKGFLNSGIKMINSNQLQVHKFVNSSAILLTPKSKEALETKIK